MGLFFIFCPELYSTVGLRCGTPLKKIINIIFFEKNYVILVYTACTGQ